MSLHERKEIAFFLNKTKEASNGTCAHYRTVVWQKEEHKNANHHTTTHRF